MEILQENLSESNDINKTKVLGLFEPAIGDQTDKSHLLHEFLSDINLDALNNLLMKQFTEEEHLLKLLM